MNICEMLIIFFEIWILLTTYKNDRRYDNGMGNKKNKKKTSHTLRPLARFIARSGRNTRKTRRILITENVPFL